MCGRIDFHDVVPFEEDVRKYYEGDISDYIYYEDFIPSYNVTPQSNIPVWYEIDHKPYIQAMHWGLIPFWAKEKSIGNRMINARSETLSEKPSFRAAYKHRHCLIPVNGFYEWMKQPNQKHKQPYYFKSREQSYMLVAGLWEEWGDEKLRSCTIITTEANEMMKPIYDRMPVIIKPKDARLWLDEEVTEKEVLEPLLKPIQETYLEHYAVSEYVNSPVHNDVKCIEKV